MRGFSTHTRKVKSPIYLKDVSGIPTIEAEHSYFGDSVARLASEDFGTTYKMARLH